MSTAVKMMFAGPVRFYSDVHHINVVAANSLNVTADEQRLFQSWTVDDIAETVGKV